MSNAVVKACNTSVSVKNTGKECDSAMAATAMLIAIDKTVKFTLADLLDPVTWLTTLIHQRKAFPIFGQEAPIRSITNGSDSDITITLDDGTLVFVRYGVYNRTFATTSGGLCYASALQSFVNSGFSIIEIDQLGQMLVRQNADKTMSGFLTSFMYAPSPQMADLKSTVYMNRFQISYTPGEIVNNGVILKNASPLLSMMGLIDAVLTDATGSSTTKLKIAISTECAGSDLLALFPTQIPIAANFIVTNKATGVVVSISAAAIVSGHLELTGTFTTATTYRVYGATPFVWFGNSVIGYDASGSYVDILIP